MITQEDIDAMRDDGAPERIWAYKWHQYEKRNGDSQVEYIRADLVPQWQPIETAPKDGAKVKVVSVVDGQWYQSDVAWWDEVSGRWENGQDYDEWNLTYWMPLPNPPKLDTTT